MNITSLAGSERKYLPAYALAGMAMEFLGSHQEKYINGIDSDETAYWLNLGREGLRNALIKINIPIVKRGTWNRTFLTGADLTKNNKAYALFKITELIFICCF